MTYAQLRPHLHEPDLIGMSARDAHCIAREETVDDTDAERHRPVSDANADACEENPRRGAEGPSSTAWTRHHTLARGPKALNRLLLPAPATKQEPPMEGTAPELVTRQADSTWQTNAGRIERRNRRASYQ